MGHQKIPFPQMDWEPGGHPLERKKRDLALPVTLLEFAPGFRDPNWCANGHLGFVLSGSLTLEYDESTDVIGEGEAFSIDPGTGHRAANAGASPVRLLILTWGASASSPGSPR